MSDEIRNPTGFFNIESSVAKLEQSDVKQAVLTYLENKYEETFTIEMLKLEFNGQDTYYRAVFSSEQRPEKGVLYCSDSGEGTSVEIDDATCVMRDDYANVILQTEYAEQIQQALGEDVLVKCQIKTPDGMISDDDFAAGLKTCVENPAYGVQLYVVILADASAKNGQIKEKAESVMSRLNVYRQYLYVAYETDIDLHIWENHYLHNTEDFARYVADQSEADYVEFTSFHADKGIVTQTVIKE